MMQTTAPCLNILRAHFVLKVRSASPVRVPPDQSCTWLLTPASAVSTSRTFSWRVRRELAIRRGLFDVVHDNQTFGSGLLGVMADGPGLVGPLGVQ